jgi:hypothetical protein
MATLYAIVRLLLLIHAAGRSCSCRLWALGHYVRLAAADRPAGAAICALVRALSARLYSRLSWSAPATFWPP